MSSTIYKTVISDYFKTPEILIFSIILPVLSFLIKIIPIVKDFTITTSVFFSIFLCIPSLADSIFLLRGFLSSGFLNQVKKQDKIAQYSSLFVFTICFIRSFLLIIPKLANFPSLMPIAFLEKELLQIFLIYITITLACALVFILSGMFLGHFSFAFITCVTVIFLEVLSNIDLKLVYGSVEYLAFILVPIFLLLLYLAISKRLT